MRPSPRALRTLDRAVLACVAIAIGWIGSGALAAYALTRRRTAAFAEPAPPGYVARRIRARDGVHIGAWLAEDEGDRAAVVLVHGNGASRAVLLEEAGVFRDAGCSVMPISVRAHGDSEGARNDIGWSARHDVVAAVEHLRHARPSRPVLVYGASLGAAAALFAAPDLGRRVRGYVLVAPYADLRLAVERRTRRYLPSPLDRVAFGALRVGGPLVLPELDRMRPVASAARMPAEIPVLVFAGDADDRAPPDDARRISEPLARARVVIVPGMEHESIGSLAFRPDWVASVREFVAHSIARERGPAP
jgi:alpha-beta hydrolase superfamily lysophospholipase